MFDGPQCQQTKRSFGGGGYAWLPPIRPCFRSRVSLEFLAESADGLLLYDGPLNSAHPGEPQDFIAIGEFTRRQGCWGWWAWPLWAHTHHWCVSPPCVQR